MDEDSSSDDDETNDEHTFDISRHVSKNSDDRNETYDSRYIPIPTVASPRSKASKEKAIKEASKVSSSS